MRILLVLAAVTLAGLPGARAGSADPDLSPDWVLGGLDNPESVVFDRSGAVLFVSNVNGDADARDGNGYIARISPDGRMLEQKWATGLDAPKGLARIGTTLYVADIDRLVEIDTATGMIGRTVAVPDAVFLNDVTTLDGETVLISDSGSSTIYQYRDGDVSVWLRDDRFGGINGLLQDGDRLLAVTMSAGELLAIDLASKQVSVIAGGMRNADMVAPLDHDDYIVSSWPGALWHVSAAGDVRRLLDTEAEEIYMNDFIRTGNRLIVPNWQPGTVRAFTITCRTH